MSVQVKPAWWKESVIYQIYPASFKSTGAGSVPGWGDIRGITSRLDYLKDLGVDIVWSSPFFTSPQADMGYDIADYNDVDPRYGSLADVDELISELKKRDMKLMIDLVVNHTSEEHQWFLDSRSSKSSSKRDWYIWQPPKHNASGERVPPNNWFSLLGNALSAWTWDEQTQEYYLSLFTPEQPDLNWRNPAVRKAVHDILRFWLDRGASGFRMDVINLISKVDGFPDGEVVYPDMRYQPGMPFFANGPHLHEYLREMNDQVLSKYDSITVGEMPFCSDKDEILKVVGEDRKELNMIFIFDIVDIDNIPGGVRMGVQKFGSKDIRNIVNKYQRMMLEGKGWNSVFIENHDNPRSVTRFTDDSTHELRELGSKLLCLMQTTLAGTLFVYQGEEIGMSNLLLDVPPEEYKDIETINYWKSVQEKCGSNDQQALDHGRKVIQRKARDHSRTPVQWSSGPNAGFCDQAVQPWMMVNPNYKQVNAEEQLQPRKDGEPMSIFQFWQRGLANRKKHKDVFVYGDFHLLDEKDESVFAYKRASNDEAFVVVLNFTGQEVEWVVSDTAKVEKWVAGNYTDEAPEKEVKGSIMLKPWEGLLGKPSISP